MKTLKRALIYARVSTLQGDQKPEVQLHELRLFCRARGWEITEEIVDHGYSGASEKRPGLRQLKALVRQRKVDVVIVSKLDRLFRSLQHIISSLQEFDDLGVDFISLHDQIDLTTAAGTLHLHLIAAFSQFELSLISSRTKEGMAYARARGKRIGRPETKDTKRILSLRAKGISYRAIAKELGCSTSAVCRAIAAASKGVEKLNQRRKWKQMVTSLNKPKIFEPKSADFELPFNFLHRATFLPSWDSVVSNRATSRIRVRPSHENFDEYLEES